ncbi:MAG: hypothetical protein HQL18_03730, partial [Candidatus Omnitrophica bacterium]|nr:hypothetical protein [Candidatus Omnitrophota bacterium]
MIFFESNIVEKFYIITAFITGIGSLCLGFFVYHKNKAKPLNVLYALLSLFIGLWSLSLFLCHMVPDVLDALWWNRRLHLFSIFIPISFFHFTLELVSLKKRRSFLLWFGYVMALGLAVFAFTPLLVRGLEPKFDFRIWPVPGPLYLPFLTFFTFYSYYSLWLIFKSYHKAVGIRRNQLRLIFIGLFIGFSGGATNFAYFYNIHLPPVGNLFVFFYLGFLGYAIIKYRLMDTNVVLVRTGIFLTIYTLVLGIPVGIGFWMMGQGPWLIPLALMGVLATVGPFAYLYFQQKAEEQLLWEQRRYQKTLTQASAGMGRIRELDKLLNLIAFILTRAVKIEHVMIYLLCRENQEYALGAFRRIKGNDWEVPKTFPTDSLLLRPLRKDGLPLIYEDLLHAATPEAMAMAADMARMRISLLFPVFIRSELMTIVALGPKSRNGMYVEDDISVFTILANQAALAIENALFYEDMKRTQEQLFKAEKMATIGIMADGLSHQINNRLHAMGFIAGDMMDTLVMKKDLFTTDELKALEEEFRKGFARLEENVVHGRNIVQGLMKYTRKGEEGFGPCEVAAILASAWEMVQFKIKPEKMKLVKNFPEGLKVKGNFTQIQEVFFNLIDNAYDAMMQRQDELAEPGYAPTLVISSVSR